MAETTSTGKRTGTAKRTATSAKATAASAPDATAAATKVRVTRAQQIAERAMPAPVGASLLARDNVVSTVNGLATKFRTRATAVKQNRHRVEKLVSDAQTRIGSIA